MDDPSLIGILLAMIGPLIAGIIKKKIAEFIWRVFLDLCRVVCNIFGGIFEFVENVFCIIKELVIGAAKLTAALLISIGFTAMVISSCGLIK
jgi:hypothetical protein